MSETKISFNNSLRELFEYDDPSFPVIVWKGNFCDFINRSLACHRHNEFEYCVVLSGTVGFNTEGHYTEVKQGEAMFVNANALHFATQVSQSDVIVFTVSFLPSLFASTEGNVIYRKFFLPVLQSPVKSLLISDTSKTGDIILKYLKKLYTEYSKQDHYYELVCIDYISKLWRSTLAYFQESTEDLPMQIMDQECEKKAKAILNYIHNHYDENIKISDIANSVKTSRSGCFRYFRQYTNKTPIEYLTDYRLLRAAQLMAQTDKSLTQIALECGFSDSSYFGKIFFKKYQATPLQYKKMIKSNSFISNTVHHINKYSIKHK